ncbi:MAG: hybrid sensor histidine kinase/response regulator, partial [Acinetobacter sp.]
MSNFNKKLFKRLKLNHAYGQLIAMIFVPIMIMACVGTVLVLSETSAAAKSKQRFAAIAILSRYQYTAEQLTVIVGQSLAQKIQAESILQKMFNEKYLLSAAVLDENNVNHLSIGYQNKRNWPEIPKTSTFFGPISSKHNNIYGLKLNPTDTAKNMWLVIELDNQPLEIARYRVMIVLITTALFTLLLLLLCLNFYSRRWIAPMY